MEVYDIFMYTPLGKKKGELSARITNGKLSGFLCLLGHTEPMEGFVDRRGNCSLKGKFVTLMRSVDFTADGILCPDFLRLTVIGGGGRYEMLGQLRKEGGCSDL